MPPHLVGCHAARDDQRIKVVRIDPDWVVIESRDHARNGEILVALINGEEATLKRIEQTPNVVLLHAETRTYAPHFVAPDRLRIQGVLVGQMRRYL